MGATNTAEREPTLATGLLPITTIDRVATDFQEYATPEELIYVERPSRIAHKYGQAHAFTARVSNAQIIGTGSLVVDGRLVVHGLSTGNYEASIQHQLGNYRMVPDGGSLEGEYVLLWGDPNFGHWVITYLLRLANLWYEPKLKNNWLLLKRGIPNRYLDWLVRMGFEDFKYADDGVRVEKLIVPSVVCYRGHYEDKGAYIWPESVHILREALLNGKRRRGTKRIYLSRARAKWRRLENEDEVSDLLERHGIVRVYLEDMTVEEQIDLISQCELIVVHFGAASPITMLAPTNCRIVEIAAGNVVGTFASRCWAHILGQKFQRVNAKPIAKTGPLPTDWDANLNTEELRNAI